MDYVIKNHKNVYIKLNEKGSPVTCSENVKGIFEYHKAKNICDALPKTLKKLQFKVEAIPEIVSKETTEKVIENIDYIPSVDITRWVEKFGECADILNEAKQRETELIEALREADNEFLDILHIVELEKSKDMYSGWQEYKRIKNNRERRRNIKDELMIVENVLSKIDISLVQRERVQKAIDGLFTRKYSIRIVEEEVINEIM